MGEKGGWYPEKPEGADKDALAVFAKKVEMAKFFGGQARDGSGDGVKKPALPAVAPPVMTQPIPSGKKRKSREGC